ncbi:MAG: septum formation initiator family protein [Candidatus Doudnabacteria bacterium]
MSKLKLPKSLYSKSLLVVMVIIALVVGSLEFKRWKERKAVDQEIQSLVEQEQLLKSQNQELTESIQFLSSPEYQEKLARLQLNLQKEGEIVVSFPTEPENTSINTQETNHQNNIIKWWNYIFIN